uniref:Uncharacterized protein n=1 Tax=Plectus sambesii TaxID=2011161 RepID=A0A914VM08_9BILA
MSDAYTNNNSKKDSEQRERRYSIGCCNRSAEAVVWPFPKYEAAVDPAENTMREFDSILQHDSDLVVSRPSERGRRLSIHTLTGSSWLSKNNCDMKLRRHTVCPPAFQLPIAPPGVERIDSQDIRAEFRLPDVDLQLRARSQSTMRMNGLQLVRLKNTAPTTRRNNRPLPAIYVSTAEQGCAT